MKTDLDTLMQVNDIDAILVTGPGDHNPPMVYLTGNSTLNLTNADLIKVRGQAPILFHANMERDEAARTGLATRNLADFNLQEMMKAVNGDMLAFHTRRYQRMLTDCGLTSGKVALYGQMDAGRVLTIFNELQRSMPGLSFASESANSILIQAMSTKDADEVSRMRRMGQVTTSVVGNIADFLSSHAGRDGVLVQTDGQPVTIGMVKRRINLLLAEAGVENPEGTIFSIGADAAVPHSSGKAEDILRLGQTIIFDIFPCEAGGGYYYDFTRTWCLGYASDQALRLYEDVLHVFRTVTASLQLGMPTRQPMQLTCELFEARGHPTQRSHPNSQEGFVHGLGHGVGLYIHELPQFGLFSAENEILKAGAVVTIEPGLYYPQKEMGVRLEDTIWMSPSGQAETLAEYPLDLVLPVRGT
jgi:Xaa-Pro aminopeptidase